MDVFQVVGYKNTGKTTLICRLISGLVEQGLRVGTIKHDAHRFETDHPGTDTWKHRAAGVQTVAITSENRTVVMEQHHTPLELLLEKFQQIDIVLVEGFKFEKYPKIVIIKSDDHLELVHQLGNVKGIVSWLPKESLPAQLGIDVPCMFIDDESSVLRLILETRNESALTSKGLVEF